MGRTNRARNVVATLVALALCVTDCPSAAGAETNCYLDESFAPQLTRLRITIENRHIAWNTVRGGIRDVIISESIATGFSPHRVIAGFQSLLDREESLNDAKAILGIADEAARALGVDPSTILKALYAAISGQNNAPIEGLDPSVKAIIDRHGRLSEVLSQMHKDFNYAVNAKDNPVLNYDRSRVLRELQCPDAP